MATYTSEHIQRPLENARQALGAAVAEAAKMESEEELEKESEKESEKELEKKSEGIREGISPAKMVPNVEDDQIRLRHGRCSLRRRPALPKATCSAHSAAIR